jgi:hypothetical protein
MPPREVRLLPEFELDTGQSSSLQRGSFVRAGKIYRGLTCRGHIPSLALVGVAVAHRVSHKTSVLRVRPSRAARGARRGRTLGGAPRQKSRRASHAAGCHFCNGLLQAFRRDGLR